MGVGNGFLAAELRESPNLFSTPRSIHNTTLAGQTDNQGRWIVDLKTESAQLSGLIKTGPGQICIGRDEMPEEGQSMRPLIAHLLSSKGSWAEMVCSKAWFEWTDEGLRPSSSLSVGSKLPWLFAKRETWF